MLYSAHTGGVAPRRGPFGVAVQENMHFLYILQSQKRGSYYIGCSSDVKQRLLEHNKGFTRSTKPYRPWVLIYTERLGTKSEAMKREWYLKHPKGYLEKKTIVEQYRESGGVA